MVKKLAPFNKNCLLSSTAKTEQKRPHSVEDLTNLVRNSCPLLRRVGEMEVGNRNSVSELEKSLRSDLRQFLSPCLSNSSLLVDAYLSWHRYSNWNHTAALCKLPPLMATSTFPGRHSNSLTSDPRLMLLILALDIWVIGNFQFLKNPRGHMWPIWQEDGF